MTTISAKQVIVSVQEIGKVEYEFFPPHYVYHLVVNGHVLVSLRLRPRKYTEMTHVNVGGKTPRWEMKEVTRYNSVTSHVDVTFHDVFGYGKSAEKLCRVSDVAHLLGRFGINAAFLMDKAVEMGWKPEQF